MSRVLRTKFQIIGYSRPFKTGDCQQKWPLPFFQRCCTMQSFSSAFPGQQRDSERCTIRVSNSCRQHLPLNPCVPHMSHLVLSASPESLCLSTDELSSCRNVSSQTVIRLVGLSSGSISHKVCCMVTEPHELRPHVTWPLEARKGVLLSEPVRLAVVGVSYNRTGVKQMTQRYISDVFFRFVFRRKPTACRVVSRPQCFVTSHNTIDWRWDTSNRSVWLMRSILLTPAVGRNVSINNVSADLLRSACCAQSISTTRQIGCRVHVTLYRHVFSCY